MSDKALTEFLSEAQEIIDALNANLPWLYDLQDARGYGSIITRQYADYMALIYDQYELLYNRIAPLSTDQIQALDSTLLDLLNVKYVVTEVEITSPRYALVYDGEVRIYDEVGRFVGPAEIEELHAMSCRVQCLSNVVQADGRDSREAAIDRITRAYAGEPQSFAWIRSLATFTATPSSANFSLLA